MAQSGNRAWLKRRWVRWTLLGVGGVVLLLLLIVLLLPTLLSSGPGTRFLVARINAMIPGTVDIGDLSLSWLGGQEAQQLRLSDADGQLVAEVQRIILADVGLLGLATGSRDLGEIAIDRPWLDVVADEQGVTNLERALGLTPAAEPIRRDPEEAPDASGDRPGEGPAGEEPGLVPADLSVAVRLIDGEARYRAPGLEPVQATLPQIALEMPSPRLITFDVQTQLQQGTQHGEIEAEGRLEQLFDARGRLDLQSAQVRADTRMADLPVPLIDRLARLQDTPLALLLGPTLTAEAAASGTVDDMTIRLVADAAQAAADLQARLTPDALRTTGPGKLRLTLVPEAFAQWTGSPATLREPVTLGLTLSELVAPLREGQPALRASAAAVSLTVDDAPLDVPGFGRVTVRGTSARLDLQPDRATLSADLSIAQQASAGTLSLRATVSDLFNLADEIDLPGANVDTTLIARDLPLDVIDRIAGMEGQLADLVGPTLQVRAMAQGRMDNLVASLTAEAQHLAADLAVKATPQRVAGRGDGSVGTVRLSVPAEVASRYLAAGEGDQAGPAVREPVAVTLSLAALSVPVDQGAVQPMQASLTADLTVARTTLDVPQLGRVQLEELAARIETPGIDQRLTARARAVTRAGEQQGSVALNLSATNLLDAQQALALDGAQLDATLRATDLPVGVVDQLTGQQGVLRALLGPTLQLEAAAKGQLADLAATLRARAQHLDADLALAATPTMLTGRDGGAGTVRLTVTPDAARLIQGGGEEVILPAAPLALSLKLPALAVPMNEGAPQLAAAKLRAEFAVEPVTLQVPAVGALQLRAAQATLESDRLANGLAIDAGAETVMADRTGSLSATARVTELLNEAGALQTESLVAPYTLTARDLPAIALLDTMLEQQGLLVAAAGPSVTADATGTWRAQAGGGPIEATVVAGPHRLELDGLLEADRVAVQQAQAAFTLSPAFFDRLMAAPAPQDAVGARPPAVKLARPATLRLAVEQARLPTELDPARTSLTAQLTAEPLVFQHAGGEAPITLADLVLGITATALNEPIQLTARGDLPAPEGAPAADEQAGLRSTSTLHLAFSDAGELDLDATRLATETVISRFPMALVDQFAQAEVRLVPILGPVASLELAGRYPGPVQLKAVSPTSQAQLAGVVRRQKFSAARLERGDEPPIILDLQEDLTAQLWITPEMVSELMGRMHPMFQDAVASESPVRFTISQESGNIPLTGLDLGALRLAGVLDAGQVRMRRGGWLEETVSLITGQLKQAIGLGADVQRNVAVETYVATFTPLRFSLDKGILDMPETWVTSDDLAVGFAGSVDLNDAAAPRIRQMVMGLLQASLVVEAPTLGRFLQADQVAELPMSGPLSEPEIDYSTLAKDLAGSGLVQTARERGGEVGSILGGIIEGVGQGMRQKRARETGVSWSPPAAARALIAKARRLGEEPDPQQRSEPTPAEQRNPATPQDILRDLLGQ